MTSAVVSLAAEPGLPALVADLESVGIHVIGAIDPHDMVREVIRSQPDVLVCYDRHPDDPLFETFAALAATAPLPTVLFTEDHAAEKIERSARCGIHAYVVSGYASHRLRPTIQLARARFRHEQSLRGELDDVTRRFEERKLVDRAKGILMRARQISEEDAFRILRTTSMHSKRRVGRVSQQVIDAARDAEAVNRAGLVRMLSQQVVKRYALAALERDAVEPSVASASDRIDRQLATLEQALSRDTYGDLLIAIRDAWSPLKVAVVPRPELARIATIDVLAEALLARADQLTTYLQTAGSSGSLKVINVSGRQRMLAQRVAKQRLIGDHAGAAETRAALDDGLRYLGGIPLVSREITALLAEARERWGALCEALDAARGPVDRQALGAIGDTLSALFDRLTEQYERSMEMLIG